MRAAGAVYAVFIMIVPVVLAEDMSLVLGNGEAA
jgi:hypothetical protein